MGREKKKPEDRTLNDEISNKIYSIDVVRTARIKASGRLYKYSEAWDFLFLLMNVVSVALLIVSILPLPINDSKSGLLVSAFYSLYTMIVQYFCSTLNYNERALKYHYHQLELENFILQLKNLFLKDKVEGIDQDEKEKFIRYKGIMEKYQISLQGYENHSDLDYRVAKKQISSYTRPDSCENSSVEDITADNDDDLKSNSSDSSNEGCLVKFLRWKEYKDFSPDNIFIYLQFPIVIFVIVAYIFIAIANIK